MRKNANSEWTPAFVHLNFFSGPIVENAMEKKRYAYRAFRSYDDSNSVLRLELDVYRMHLIGKYPAR
jgi:hypothetical protein